MGNHSLVFFMEGVSMSRVVLSVALAAIVLTGCERESAPVSTIRAVETNSVSEAKDFVAVRIDGRDLSRKEIIRAGRAVLLLNMNKARKTKIRKREVRAVENYCRTAVNREIAKSAVMRYIADRGLTIPTNVLKRATRSFERRYGASSRKLKRSHNLADLKFMLGKDAFRADEMIMEMAAFEVMTNDVISTTKIAVDENAVNSRIEWIRKANMRAAATNAVVFARATNVWQKIIAKELTFEAAAKAYSEDEYINEGCEWGCFTRDQLEDDPLVLELLPTLKVGDVTAPIESDGGVSILRKDEDDNDKTYSFSRVFFRLPYFYEEETPEQARATILEDRRKELVQQTIRDYSRKLKVEYPNGTNMVWRLTPQDFR